MTRLLALLAVAAGSLGCTHSLGSLPAVPLPTDAPPAFKLIRPDAQAEACRTTWLGASAPADDRGLLAAAVADLRAIDPEVEQLYDLRIATSGWHLGVVRRECVTVTANLGRPVPVMRLGGHEHHQHHHH